MATARAAVAAGFAEHVFLDIETGNLGAEAMKDLRERFVAEWEAPANYKDAAKIEAKRAEDLAKWMERAALLPQAPVRVAAVLLPDNSRDAEMYQFHSMKREKARWEGRAGSVAVEGFASEADMMTALKMLLADVAGSETILVGHNVLNFDLPRLRLATVRSGLELPEALQLKMPAGSKDGEEMRQPVFDTMQQYGRRFLGQLGPCFVSQEEMLNQMGIRALVKRETVSGAEIPGLLDAGKLDVVLMKNRADLLDLRKAFYRMTGRS